MKVEIEQIFYEKTIGIPPVKLYSLDRKKWFDNLNDMYGYYNPEYAKKVKEVRLKIKNLLNKELRNEKVF